MADDGPDDWVPVIIFHRLDGIVATNLTSPTSFEEAHAHLRHAMRDDTVRDTPHKASIMRMSYMLVRQSYMEYMRGDKDGIITH